MAHRISCGALVVHEDQILLVHHYRAGKHDFWAAPGGGVEGAEELSACAAREVLEETGLTVEVGPLAYVDELFSATDRAVKFWFLARYVRGEIDISANPADDESIIAAAWHPLDALPSGPVFPEPLTERFTADLATGFAQPIKLPLRELRFQRAV